jgi:hypothetical protein
MLEGTWNSQKSISRTKKRVSESCSSWFIRKGGAVPSAATQTKSAYMKIIVILGISAIAARAAAAFSPPGPELASKALTDRLQKSSGS